MPIKVSISLIFNFNSMTNNDYNFGTYLKLTISQQISLWLYLRIHHPVVNLSKLLPTNIALCKKRMPDDVLSCMMHG